MAEQETKNCPFCAEIVNVNAKKCKHCGEFLDESIRPVSNTSSPQKSAPERIIWEGTPSHLHFLGDHIVWGIIGCVTIIGFLGNLYIFLKTKSTKYKFTNKRLSTEMGVLSKQTAEVAIKDIRSVNSKQGLFERLFGLGTVEIGTAGTAGIEVSFVGIPDAPKIKDQITQLKNDL